jgi:hypothetical protein
MEKRTFKEFRFQGLNAANSATVEAMARRVLGAAPRMLLSLDFALAYVENNALKIPSVKVNLDPPPILYSQEPAILVIFMGEPEFKPVEGGVDLQFAVNTNWDLLFHPASKRYYLLHGDGWLSTTDPKNGPWEAAGNLPAELWKIPASDNWADVKKNLPGRKIAVPKVFPVTTPSELIVVDGRPVYAPIPGTGLAYVTNTKSQLFIHEGESRYYFLTSGRWFRSKSLEGPWTAATTDLPEDFRKIPKDSPKADVRVSVPGTSEAVDAVLLAVVPRKASVSRTEVTVKVTYDGQPNFVKIEGTKGEVYYAINSPFKVFRVGDKYYCCHNGIWFECGAPDGTWVVCVIVPTEIYTIPSTHPSYPVTYVHVYSYTPTTVVVGYTSGYTGCYVAYGCVMFGVGYAVAWSSPYWYYHYPPYYYGYGCGAYYSYSYGAYYRSAAVYGPYGGAGFTTAYNPYTGTYSRSAYAYGPGGSRYAQSAYNPYTGGYAARSGGSTPYSSWSRGVAAKGGEWVRGGSYTDARGTVAGASTSRGGKVIAGEGAGPGGNSGFVGKTGEGDLYAGKNGEVYRKTDGGWQHYDNGEWTSPDRPQPKDKATTSDRERPTTSDRERPTQEPSQTRQQLDRDSASRSRGYENMQRSYGGGGRRGGGGGRR